MSPKQSRQSRPTRSPEVIEAALAAQRDQLVGDVEQLAARGRGDELRPGEVEDPVGHGGVGNSDHGSPAGMWGRHVLRAPSVLF